MYKAADLFGGVGGTTEGAEQAGIDVVYAANHCPYAIEYHSKNHPNVQHACQDLRQADFRELPAFDLLLASPSCKGHSQTSQPRRTLKHESDRSTAWAVIDCLETCRPKAFVVENVPDFKRWMLYGVWRAALRKLGYSVQQHLLDAADFGVPQHRRRVFFVGYLGKMRKHQIVGGARLKPCSTILDPDASGWELISRKPAGVRERVAKARARGLGERFLVHQVTGHGGRELARPMATITTARSHWHLVEGRYIRPLTIRELARGQGFSDDYELPEDNITVGTRLVGDAVPPPLARAVITGAVSAL